MINKNKNGIIQLNTRVPFNDERVDEFYNDVKAITDKYRGNLMTEDIIADLERDLSCLLSEEKYSGCTIKGDDFYREEDWTLEKILSIYSKEYPNRFNEKKKEYTNIEVNNILFDLHLKGVIGGYRSPAIPYEFYPPNEEIFTKESVMVAVPMINIGKGDIND